MYRKTWIACLFIASTAVHAGADFRSVGSLTGGLDSSALGVSADGNWVVGLASSSTGLQAFRWSIPTTIVGLGNYSDGSGSVAYACSRNGKVVVGGANHADHQEAFRWTAESGLVGLGDLWPDEPLAGSVAYAISGDGLQIGGSSDVEAGVEGFRWTQANGLQGLGSFPGDIAYLTSEAYAISTDGSTFVGQGDDGFATTAFKWNGSGPIEALYYLPPAGSYSIATACSANGSTIVGYGDDGTDTRGWIWAGGSMVALPPVIPAIPDLFPAGISGDGTIVVGRGYTFSGETAFIWTSAGGTRELKTVLQSDYGLNLSGWTLIAANAINEDGTVIVGTGTNAGRTKGWVARLPKPGTVEATVTLQALTYDVAEGEDVVVELRSPGNPTPIETRNMELDSIGMIRFVTSLRGTYDLAVKGTNWLRQVHSVVITNSSVTAAPYVLINGDVNGDNEVGIGDYSLLSNAYNSFEGDPNWNSSADLNRDGGVDIGDYAILSSSYGQFGDD